MKNPLNKRLPRELRGEMGKYIVIFLFMLLTIGFISGFLVAGHSMKVAYDESFDKFNIEDGHFELAHMADKNTVAEIEKLGVELYENFYIQKDIITPKSDDSKIRMFRDRSYINKVCVMEGKKPVKSGEIAIDRLFAVNNDIHIGDNVKVAKRTFKVTGFVALSDYSALFESQTDLMFDSIKFGVGILCDEDFESFNAGKVFYNYAFLFSDEPKDEVDAKKMSDEFLDNLVKIVLPESYMPEYANMAIHFTGDDIGGDETLITVLLYVLIVILSFVFVITISHTIVKEANVIGTLRASGYSKWELIRHYMAIPMIVTFVASAIGNILGYTVFKNVVVGLYYGSYSLPTYTTLWNTQAFVKTTVIPMIIMIVVNLIYLLRMFRFSPLKFIRRDLSKSKRKKAIMLPHFSFFRRFRIRIILQNMPNYAVLFVGIAFASILLLFGMMMHPLLSHYQDEVLDNMISEYQYVLSSQVEVDCENAEKYAVTSLCICEDGDDNNDKVNDNGYDNGEEVTIYGIADGSKYISDVFEEDKVVISSSYAEKYRINAGDTIKLKDKYSDKLYEFEVSSVKNYPSSISIFMAGEMFNVTFDKKEGYFNGYFTNELLDIHEKAIVSVINRDELTKTSRQLEKSMGEMFKLINVFAIVLAAILIYLLTKVIIEKNVNAISMVKILGYSNSEIARLYLVATSLVVVISTVISVSIARVAMDTLYYELMKGYSGWLSLYISPIIYLEMVMVILAVYAVVAVLQFRKIKKVPMDQALKNAE